MGAIQARSVIYAISSQIQVLSFGSNGNSGTTDAHGCADARLGEVNPHWAEGDTLADVNSHSDILVARQLPTACIIRKGIGEAMSGVRSRRMWWSDLVVADVVGIGGVNGRR